MLHELLKEELRDLLNAENQLVKALPKMAKAANSEELKSAFQDHLEQTRGHVERLNQAFEMLGEKARSKSCKGMAGLIQEGREVIEDGKKMDEPMADLALIGAAQRVEHYEIAAYGTARAMAEQMDRKDIARVLGETLAEEEKADQLLTKIANACYEEAKEMSVQEVG